MSEQALSPQQTALVTGASRGIGRAVALALLERGYRVFGISRTDPEIDHASFAHVAADVSRPSDLLIAERKLEQGYRVTRIDALVHAAGVQGPVGPLGTSPYFAWTDAIKVNLIGAFGVSQMALPLLRAAGGRALFLVGHGAFGPRPNYSAYAASNSGIVSLMESLAEEEPGVAFNCILLGFVPSEMHVATIDAGPSAAGTRAYRMAIDGILKNDGSSLELTVDCILHLLSDRAAGLTGLTVSAIHDAWRSIEPDTVGPIRRTGAGRRIRTAMRKVEIRQGYVYLTQPNGTILREMRN